MILKFLKRLFSIFSAEANNAVSKLEDPIKMTEQGIRELKTDLQKSLEGLASVKAQSNRLGKEVSDSSYKSKDYEKKATLLLQRASNGTMDVAEAERLAKEALSRKSQADNNLKVATANKAKVDDAISKMEGNVNKLKTTINHYENELKTLKSRKKVSEATTKLNKQLSEVDSGSTITMLERMKEKVEEQESLAEAYGDIAAQNTSIDIQLDNALEEVDTNADMALEELKAKLNMNKEDQASEEAI